MSKVYKHSSLEKKTTEVKIVGIPSFMDISPKTDPEFDHHEQEELDQAESLATRVIADAEEMAKKIIEQAKEDMLLLQSQAEQEMAEQRLQHELACKQLSEQAYNEGYQAGFNEGKNEGQHMALQEYQSLLDSAKEVLEQTFLDKDQILEESEAFLITLSVEISQKIMGQALELQPELALTMVKETLGRIKERESVSIHVHPRDYGLVQAQRQQLLSLVHEQAEVKVYPDHTIGQGGCIVRTSQGSLDARIDTQLTEIRNHLMNLWQDERHE